MLFVKTTVIQALINLQSGYAECFCLLMFSRGLLLDTFFRFVTYKETFI